MTAMNRSNTSKQNYGSGKVVGYSKKERKDMDALMNKVNPSFESYGEDRTSVPSELSAARQAGKNVGLTEVPPKPGRKPKRKAGGGSMGYKHGGTIDYKHGGPACARGTGQGFGAARKPKG